MGEVGNDVASLGCFLDLAVVGIGISSLESVAGSTSACSAALLFSSCCDWFSACRSACEISAAQVSAVFRSCGLFGLTVWSCFGLVLGGSN